MKTTFKSNCCVINTNEICRLMYSYEKTTGENPKYLIMSRETYELLKSQNEKIMEKGSLFPNSANNIVSQFCGIDIAECNKLKLGEVEAV